MSGEPADGPTEAPSLGEEPATGPHPLSASERAAAFSTGITRADRSAAFRAGTVPVPRRFVLWIIVGFAVLGLGGIVGEKLIGNAGVGALISTPVTTLAGTGGSGAGATGGAAPGPPAPPNAPAVTASPSAVIGLTHLAGIRAPAISLQNQSGARWTLAGAKGKVVVLTFFNAECDDICPVLAREITQADQLLGHRRTDVDFVVVNSDPLETSLTPVPPALTQTGLAGLTNVTFLNGPLTDLSAVWKHYGVTVALDNTNRVVTHNDVMVFIDPTGSLELGASPFANEDTLGIYSLQSAVIHTFAKGVADSAASLLKGAS
jgi:cytochrome oxidase Cu insertion factor (SCO1/SenC/PrrC family)